MSANWNRGIGLILGMLAVLAIALRIMMFSGAGVKIIAQQDMQDVLYAQNQAYEYLAEVQKDIRPILESNPEAASLMREYRAVFISRWTQLNLAECPRYNHLAEINFVQDAYDALQQCGVQIPPTVIHNSTMYNVWVTRYELITDKYNLTGWSKTPTLFRLSLENWRNPFAAAG